MPKKQKKEKELLPPLPEKDDPGYFRALARNCIKAYEKLSNDGLALDYCKVADRKLRAMILNDEEYKAETKNIYARQRLEEMEEVEYLASLAANEGGEEGGDGDDDHYEPRDGRKPPKKITGADKDMINMRFKAAQMKRELRSELSKMEGDSERDAVNLMEVAVTREEFERLITVSINEGSDDADVDALISVKEDAPIGTAQQSAVPEALEDDFFRILPNGEIVER